MRTRLTQIVLPLVALAFACAGLAAAAPATSTLTIEVSARLGGKILVNSSGFTLYHDTDEAKGKIDCTGACAKLWPPLLVGAKVKPVAGPGLGASRLGTIKRPDGGLQVTYNGLALYRYAADTKAGQSNGQGVQHAWFAVTSAGTVTKAVATAPTAAATSGAGSSGSSSSSSGGGYNY